MAPVEPKHAGSFARETAKGAVYQNREIVWTCDHDHEPADGKTARQVATDCAQGHLVDERNAEKERRVQEREAAKQAAATSAETGTQHDGSELAPASAAEIADAATQQTQAADATEAPPATATDADEGAEKLTRRVARQRSRASQDEAE
jgi:hypothetical protein